jgi:hypothetical protein
MMSWLRSFWLTFSGQKRLQDVERVLRAALKDAEQRATIMMKTCDNQDKRIREMTGAAQPDAWRILSEFGKDSIPSPVTVYSTFYLQAGSVLSYTSNRLFSTPLGAIGQGKDLGLDRADTNLREGGQLPADVQVRALVCEIIGGTSEDIAQLRATGTLMWDLVQVSVDVAPLGVFTWDAAGRTGVLKLSDIENPSEEDAKTTNLSDSGFILKKGMTFGMVLGFGRCDRTLWDTVRVRVSLCCAPLGRVIYDDPEVRKNVAFLRDVAG